MPFAVTHVLGAVILADIYRDYITKHKKYFTMHTIFIAGFFGLFPDIDVPLRMLSQFFGFDIPLLLQHGWITHTPLLALIFFIPGLVLWYNSKGRKASKADKMRKWAVYFYMAAFGILLHLLMDYVIGGGSPEGVMWLFPFSMTAWKIHLTSMVNLPDLGIALDAVILLLWLWHEEIKHKISDYI
jgi:hypothetical protein